MQPEAARPGQAPAPAPPALNPQQWEVVRHPLDEPLLVQACAGTGKTTTLIERLVFMLQQVGATWIEVCLTLIAICNATRSRPLRVPHLPLPQGVLPRRVLLVTFTVKDPCPTHPPARLPPSLQRWEAVFHPLAGGPIPQMWEDTTPPPPPGAKYKRWSMALMVAELCKSMTIALPATLTGISVGQAGRRSYRAAAEAAAEGFDPQEAAAAAAAAAAEVLPTADQQQQQQQQQQPQLLGEQQMAAEYAALPPDQQAQMAAFMTALQQQQQQQQ